MRIRITHQRITVTLQLILLAEAVFAIWVSPVTSKCTTCGHFKVHHPG